MINNIDNKLNICGIYKINYDNGKIYIGQARSIYTRALEHNSKNKYPCDKALKKHNATIEILQRITDVNLLDKARLEAKDFGTIHPSNGEDEKYEEIKKFIMESKDYVSKAMIAREFNVGFNRSKDIYDRLRINLKNFIIK